ncbi:MAG: hypothetical protein EZS28_022361, partial [Streblomastix strix]
MEVVMDKLIEKEKEKEKEKDNEDENTTPQLLHEQYPFPVTLRTVAQKYVVGGRIYDRKAVYGMIAPKKTKINEDGSITTRSSSSTAGTVAEN